MGMEVIIMENEMLFIICGYILSFSILILTVYKSLWNVILVPVFFYSYFYHYRVVKKYNIIHLYLFTFILIFGNILIFLLT